MDNIYQATQSFQDIHVAGAIAMVSGVISAIGVVFLIAMFVLFATPYKELGNQVGWLNDICVALQYLLTIPLALALYRILPGDRPILMRIATMVGIGSMIIVVGLQLLLVFKLVSFEQQVLWVSLAMILGVGFWLVTTGFAGRSTGRLPNSLLMSSLAVPYLGYPVWAFWLGLHLLGW